MIGYYKKDYPLDSKTIVDLINTSFYTILVTGRCNYLCWYCDVVSKKTHRKSRFINRNEFRKIKDFINYQDKQLTPNLVIHFFGGEPTLNTDLDYAIKLYKETFHNRNLFLLLTTNLSKPIRYFENLDKDVQVSGSLHLDYEKDIDGWFKKAKVIQDRGKLYDVDIMLHSGNYELAESVYKKYRDCFPCSILPIKQIIQDKDYLEFKQRLLKETGCDCVHDSESEAFYGDRKSTYLCSAGVVIDEFGNAYYCWNRKGRGEAIKNIFKNPYIKAPKWHICNMYGPYCDMEVVRASLDQYVKNIKDKIFSPKNGKEYTKEELNEYLAYLPFRCNA